MEAEEKAARRAVRERKLAILEQLYWQTDFRREALARANAELGTPASCEFPRSRLYLAQRGAHRVSSWRISGPGTGSGLHHTIHDVPSGL